MKWKNMQKTLKDDDPDSEDENDNDEDDIDTPNCCCCCRSRVIPKPAETHDDPASDKALTEHKESQS
jgi:hypothetical protein